jgi:predicted pyridoxine 5'-phosphate oxidase superfamily flavin-nucleotide-binding protein
MSKLYRETHRALQHEFDTERLADRIEERLCRTRFTAEDRAFIERLDLFFLATVDAAGQPTCSYKGGDPGFVRLLDDQTLAFPSYDGNGMFLSAGNVREHGDVGLLFIDFETPKRLRVHGRAKLAASSFVSPPFEGAQFVVVVEAKAIFPNCPRYIHQRRGVERSPYVPRAGLTPPIPAWKQMDWARDVLPAGDPALIDPSRPPGSGTR